MVRDFMRFLAEQDPVDQRTIWAIFAEEFFPQVSSDESVFSHVCSATSLREATDEIRSAAVSGQEVSDAVARPPGSRQRKLGVTPRRNTSKENT